MKNKYKRSNAERISERFETRFKALQDDATAEIQDEMLRVAREWQARFPKRRIEFLIGANGDAFYAVDDLWIGDRKMNPRQDKRFAALLAPLLKAERWYKNVASDFSIEIKDITLNAQVQSPAGR